MAYPGGFGKHYWQQQQNRDHDTQGYWSNQTPQSTFPNVRTYQQQDQGPRSSATPSQPQYSPTGNHAVYDRQNAHNGQLQDRGATQTNDSNRMQWAHTRTDNTAAEALSRLSGVGVDRTQNAQNTQYMASTQQGQQPSYGSNQTNVYQQQQQQAQHSEQNGFQPVNAAPARDNSHTGSASQAYTTSQGSTYFSNDRNNQSVNHSRFYLANPQPATSPSYQSRPTSPQYQYSNGAQAQSSYEQQQQQQQQQQYMAQRQADQTPNNEPQHSRSPSITQLRNQSVTPNTVQQQARRAPSYRPQTSTEPSQHTFVDPTQVYDRLPEHRKLTKLYEEERQRAEAAERARKEAEQKAENDRQLEAARLAREKLDAQRAADAEAQLHAKRIADYNQRRQSQALKQKQQAIQNSGSTNPTASATPIAAPAKRPRTKLSMPLTAEPNDTSAGTGVATATDVITLNTQPSIPAQAADQSVQLANLAGSPATPASGSAISSKTGSAARGDPSGSRLETKRKLADLIIRWLTSQPANSGVHVEKEEVVRLLDANAAYAEFCDFLDSKGFWLNRALLAKVILDANPELHKGSGATKHAGTPQSRGSAAAGQSTTPAPSSQAVVAPPRTSQTPVSFAPTVAAEVPVSQTFTHATAPLSNLPQPHSSAQNVDVNVDAISDHNTSHDIVDTVPSERQTPRSLKKTRPSAEEPAKPERPTTPLTKAEKARHRGSTAFEALMIDDDDEEDEDEADDVEGTNDINGPVSHAEPTSGATFTLSPPTNPADGSSEVEKIPKDSAKTDPPVVYVPSVPDSELRGKSLVEGITRAKVARRNRYDSRTIARDVLLATGRHNGMRPLNDHLEGLRLLLATHSPGVKDQQFDLSTIRWDLVDPQPRIDDEGTMADDEGELNGDSSLSRDIVNADGTITTVATGNPAVPRGVKRKVGRPRKHQGATVPGMNVAASTGVLSNQPGGLRRSIHKPARSGAAPGSGGADNDDETMTADSGEGVSRKRGRPPKATAIEPEELVEADFAVYRCRWEGCKAQLHNLDALSKHVNKVHGRRTRGLYTCCWGRCTKGGRTLVGPSDRQTFENITSWHGHVHEAHLQSVAKRLGDGPRGNLSEAHNSEMSDSYLSDAAGRQITPRVTLSSTFNEEQLLQEQLLAPVMRQAVPRLPGGLSYEQTEDEQKLQQLETKKLQLGPAFERGGARLATDERRRGLFDDEDFAEACSADEDVPEPEE